MSAPPKDYWDFFSEEATQGQSPLYAKLALGIGADEYLKSLAMRKLPSQPAANILLASVHLLLLKGADHPLADYYPSVRPNARALGDPVPLFREFVQAHEAALIPLIECGVTNTNEVNRSCSLYPAFDWIAQGTGNGLHLIEIGPSAGFNLNFDRYAYRYTRDGGNAVTRGVANAGVSLTCALRGANEPPLADYFPAILSRQGLELNPVDLNNPEARLWLKALTWPELTDRMARLSRAIASQQRHPVVIHAGDALALLPQALAALPSGGTAVVFHSHVTYQFTPEMRAQLNETLVHASESRAIHRVSIEFHDGGYPIRLRVYDKGPGREQTLAHCNPHGTWLDWRA